MVGKVEEIIPKLADILMNPVRDLVSNGMKDLT
jgi:hypothetical protein